MMMSQVNNQAANANREATRPAYWPGHIIAECLVDDYDDKDKNNNSYTSDLVKTETTEQQSRPKSISASTLRLKPGSSFSAIINSMLPIDVISRLKSEVKNNEFVEIDEYIYDEFGFKIEREQDEEIDESKKQEKNLTTKFVRISLSPTPGSQSPTASSYSPMNKRTFYNDSTPFIEDSKHKLKWIAYLEFTLNADIGSNFSWDQVKVLNRCEKLRAMIRGQGIPHSLRSFIWMRLSGALQKKQNAKFKYVDLFKSTQHDMFHTSKQIEKDLLRTLPTNACFANQNSVGIPRLRRILQAVAWLYPNIGYCQGMGTIVASLLLFLEEEDAFWIMCAILEDLLPASYYSHTLLGVQADMKVLRQLISTYLPEIDQQFKLNDIELSLVCINWFLTIFSNVFHIKILLRVWDLFFYEGSSSMFQITLAMLKLKEANLLKATNSAQIFTILSDLPAEITDIDLLIETAIRVASSVNRNILDTCRRKHQAYLLAQQGSFVNPLNYQSLQLNRECSNLRNKFVQNKSKNILKIFKKSLKNKQQAITNGYSHQRIQDFGVVNDDNDYQANEGENLPTSSSIRSLSNTTDYINSNNVYNEDINEIKIKNIIQTEFLVNLREIILRISHHFTTSDSEQYESVNLNADYSIESHSMDYEKYMDTSKVRQFKRAKAVLDFEKTDDDELGFKKNDIITVLSTKDDHCWIGELRDEKGWFPSRFVELIDERNGKIYSAAGDDSVCERIRDLVRGEFSCALKCIFEHGLKKWSVLGGSMHPWTFIEEAAKKIVEKDFDSVYSRLVLCKTFRLDEDGKVLTPDELLFRSIQHVNLSHDAVRAQMDIKFRSLICIGLNEQVLHIWLETLCSSMEVVEKWYHPWSFIRSPGWVQIKCELRILSKFSFLLNPDAELPDNKKDSALNECIKDMLVKHHLFSWDIN